MQFQSENEPSSNASETCTTLEVCRASVSPGNGLNLTYNEVVRVKLQIIIKF